MYLYILNLWGINSVGLFFMRKIYCILRGFERKLNICYPYSVKIIKNDPQIASKGLYVLRSIF